MDIYLGKQFAVPIAVVPDALKWLAADFAKLYLRNPRGSLGEDDQKELTQLLAELAEIAKGMLSPGSDPPPAKASTRIDAATKPTLREVNREKLKGAW